MRTDSPGVCQLDATSHRHPAVSGTYEASVIATVSTPMKTGYTTTARVKAAGEQLTKATVRLADLLNAVEWK